MAQPAAYTNGTDSTYMISTLDLAKPLWAQILYEPYHDIDVREMTQMLAMSTTETVGNIAGVHYELDRETTYFQAGALFVVAGAQNIQTGPLSASLVNADGTSYVRVGDILKDNVTMQEFQVDSKSSANPPVVTLRPLNTGFSTAIPSGRILTYTTRSEKERSSAPDPVQSGTTAYTWYTQIMRDTMDITGTAENLELKPAEMEDGGAIRSWQSVLGRQTEVRLLGRQFGAFMFGVPTASAQANTAVSLSTTQGLNNMISLRGWNMNIGATALALSDLLTAVNNIKAQGATPYYQVWMGNKRMQEINSLLQTQLANSLNPLTDKSFEKLFFGSASNVEALRTTFSWQSVTIGGGINFALKELNFLNNPTTYNVTQSPVSMFQNLVYFLPIGSEAVIGEGGKKTLATHCTVMNRSRYKDRWMYVQKRGLTAGQSNDGIDHTAVDYLCDWGYRWTKGNRFGRIY